MTGAGESPREACTPMTCRNSSTQSSTHTLTFWTTNIRGLHANFSAFQHRVAVATPRPDVIVLNKTFLNPRYTGPEAYKLSGYNMERVDRQSHGGGTAVYIRDDLSFSILKKVSELKMEYIWFKLQIKGSSMLCAACYNTPGQASIFDPLSHDIDNYRVAHPGCSIQVMGDLNMHNEEWLPFTYGLDPAGEEGFVFAISNGLDQLVVEPTRYSSDAHGTVTGTTLDVFLTTQPEDFVFSGIQPHIGTSDHCVVSVSCTTVSASRPPGSRRRVWYYSGANWDDLRNYIAGIDWSTHLKKTSIEDCWEGIRDDILFGMDICIPNRVVNPNRNKPWFNRSCTKLLRRKRFLWKQWKRSGLPDDHTRYRNARQEYNRAIKARKAAYNNRMYDAAGFTVIRSSMVAACKQHHRPQVPHSYSTTRSGH